MRFNTGLTGAILIILGNICAGVVLYFPHKPSGLKRFIPIKAVNQLQARLTSLDVEKQDETTSCKTTSKDLENEFKDTKKIGQFI